MLTKKLIQPFLDDLECQGVKDKQPYRYGFLAGMAALSSILSDHIDNQAQLFVYLGMSVSEGKDFVDGKYSFGKTEPIYEHTTITNISVSDTNPQEEQQEPKIEIATDWQDWDYMPTHGDLSVSIVKKYSGQHVLFTPDYYTEPKPGRAILDLTGSTMQVIDMNGGRVPRPYYIKLK